MITRNHLRRMVGAARHAILAVGIGAMIVSTVPSFRETDWPIVDFVLAGVLAFFALDWALFVWSAFYSERPRLKLLSLVHLEHMLGVLPLVLAHSLGMPPANAWLFSSLWLLKIPTAASGFSLLFRVVSLEAKPLASVVVMFLFVLFFSAIVMHLVERAVQPAVFGSLPATLYWAVTTLTTTGYGDVVPVTPLGRLTAGIVMVAGLAVFGLWTGILATGFAAEARRREFIRTWEIIARVPFFRHVPAAAIIEIARMLRRWDVPERYVVIRKGRKGDCMYFIASGQVEVWGEGPVVQLDAGAFFGEMALMGDGVRNATVTTGVPTTLLVLGASDFRVFAAQYPELAHSVEEEAKRRRALRSIDTSPTEEVDEHIS